MGPKNGGFWGKWGSKPYILVYRPRRPPKGTSLRGTASSDVFCVKIGARIPAFSRTPPQKKVAETLCPEGAKSRMRRTETPKPIWIKFGMVVDIPDIVTYTNFVDHRLRGFWVAGVKFPPLPLTFIVALTTLSHCRASVMCVGSSPYRGMTEKSKMLQIKIVQRHEKKLYKLSWSGNWIN